MTVEALQGRIGAFHPGRNLFTFWGFFFLSYIHQVARPHPGQVEVAQTIFSLL
ncbi:hypothetical protein BY996DRAFT_7055301, partial [Phakopsora pachyrhizi]